MLSGVEVLVSKVRVGMKGGRGFDTASFPDSVCNSVGSFEAEVAQTKTQVWHSYKWIKSRVAEMAEQE